MTLEGKCKSEAGSQQRSRPAVLSTAARPFSRALGPRRVVQVASSLQTRKWVQLEGWRVEQRPGMSSATCAFSAGKRILSITAGIWQSSPESCNVISTASPERSAAVVTGFNGQVTASCKARAECSGVVRYCKTKILRLQHTGFNSILLWLSSAYRAPSPTNLLACRRTNAFPKKKHASILLPTHPTEQRTAEKPCSCSRSVDAPPKVV